MNDKEFDRRVQEWSAMPPSTNYMYTSEAESKTSHSDLAKLKEKSRVLCELFLDANREQRASLPGLIVSYTEEQKAHMSDIMAAGVNPIVADQLAGLHLFALHVSKEIKTAGDLYLFRLGLAALVLINDRIDPRDLWDARHRLYIASKKVNLDIEPHVRELATSANPETRELLLDPLGKR